MLFYIIITFIDFNIDLLSVVWFFIWFCPFFLNLGSNFHDGLGVNLQICQGGFLAENERKTCNKAIVSCSPPFSSISLPSALLLIFLLLEVLEALAPDDQCLPLLNTMDQEIDPLPRSKSSGVWRRSWNLKFNLDQCKPLWKWGHIGHFEKVL